MEKTDKKSNKGKGIKDLDEIIIEKHRETSINLSLTSLEEEIFHQLRELSLEDVDSPLPKRTEEGLSNHNIIKAHDGKVINNINYNPVTKYLVTNSIADESVIGWVVDVINDKIHQDKYYKYSKIDFLPAEDDQQIYGSYLDDVSENRYVILRNQYNYHCSK